MIFLTLPIRFTVCGPTFLLGCLLVWSWAKVLKWFFWFWQLDPQFGPTSFMSGCQSVWTGFFWFWQYVHGFSHKRTMEEVKVPFPLSNWHWHCLVSQFSVGICSVSGAISFTKLGENFLYRWGTHILGRGYLSWNVIEGRGTKNYNVYKVLDFLTFRKLYKIVDLY